MVYTKTELHRDMILKRLQENGCRVTKQRVTLLDIILNENCSSCKEIYYKAVRRIPGIGISTVYRLVGALEKIGAIDRREVYRIRDGEGSENADYLIELDNGDTHMLSNGEMNSLLTTALRLKGEISAEKVKHVSVKAGMVAEG